MAPIQGLLALKEPCEVDITTDSEYVRQGITNWIVYWKRRHWWKKNRPVRNADLWIELDDWPASTERIGAGQKGTPVTADGRAHGAFGHDLESTYVRPNPQAGLFEGLGVVENEDDPSDPG
jgi:hypothetical protein